MNKEALGYCYYTFLIFIFTVGALTYFKKEADREQAKTTVNMTQEQRIQRLEEAVQSQFELNGKLIDLIEQVSEQSEQGNEKKIRLEVLKSIKDSHNSEIM